MMRFVETSELPDDDALAARVRAYADRFVVDEGVLYYLASTEPGRARVPSDSRRLVVPASMRAEVLSQLHDDPLAGHLGFTKTYDKVRRRFFWPGMYQDTKHWVASCVDCSMKKTPRRALPGTMEPIVVDGPFDMVGVDVLGPLTMTERGNKYVVVFSDYLTKWTEAFAVPRADAVTIARLIVEEVICRYGAPKKLLSDRGAAFLSGIVSEVCKVFGIKKVNTTSYHPQTDGIVERFNHTLVTMLSMFTSHHQKDWDVFLPHVLFAYRTSVHDSTEELPFYLMFGRDPRLPIDVATRVTSDSGVSSAEEYRAQLVGRLTEAFTLAKSNLQRSQLAQVRDYNSRRRPVEYLPGDRVWLYTLHVKKGLSKKLCHLWNGQYRVEKRVGANNYVLRSVANRSLKQLVHVQRLKPFVDPSLRPMERVSLPDDDAFDAEIEPEMLAGGKEPSPAEVPEEDIEEETEYEVEKVLKKRSRRGRVQYLVKWVGYPDSNNSWVDEEEMNCDDLVADFISRTRSSDLPSSA
eukprot:ANDGO_02858.mRNA.1 Retrovirus-related Pol polyprotein from transposon 412